MADSNITKRALATSLRQLMEEMPFEKITISHICDRCDMNRKSFYYHFRDKYDLLHWIFDADFVSLCGQGNFRDGQDFLLALCEYLYNNRFFYRRAIRVRGQNSFLDHFHQMLRPVVCSYLKPMLPGEKNKDFYADLFTDGFVCAIIRWITDRNCIPPQQLVEQLRSCIQTTAECIHRRNTGEK